jgi:transposase
VNYRAGSAHKPAAKDARHQQCLQHLLRRADEMAATATRRAVCFPRRVAELLRAGLDLRERHAAGEVSRHGLAVARGRLENQVTDLVFPPKTNPANERLAQHLWAHRDELLTFLDQPGLDATNWRGELAIRFGVILRKVWGGSRTWAGARTQSVLMSVWRTCWQQGRSALDFLSQLLRRVPVALALPPQPTPCEPTQLHETRALSPSRREINKSHDLDLL